MKERDKEKLRDEELIYIPKKSICYHSFWIDETHFVITKKPDGRYMILRSFFLQDKPCVSVDNSNANMGNIVDYLVHKFVTRCDGVYTNE